LPAREGTWRAGLSAGVWRSIAAGCTLLAFALGLFLIARRATGDITSLVPIPLLVVTAGTLLACTWFARETLANAMAGNVRLAGRVVGSFEALLSLWLPILTIVLFAVALSYPGARLVDWLIWLSVLGLVLAGQFRLIPARRSSPAKVRNRRGEQLIQDLKRYRTATGRELLRGRLLAEFLPGQRSATLYAAFCPPFEFLPHVDANVIGNSAASVKLAQVMHNGVQLEVRLSRVANAQQEVTVEVLAAEPQTR
jgi:hypothetical protein